MAKAAIHGLRTTPGSFQMTGIVSRVGNKNFYTEKDFGTSKMRSVNFGVKYDTNKELFTTVQGFTRPDVYFGKKNNETGKTDTKKIAWADRLTFAENNPDWKIIGCNIGLHKDNDGKNIKRYLTEYDAAQHIKEDIRDGMTVFVRGNLDFRSYPKNNEVKRITNFNATQVSLTADVDFNAEDFEPTHHWTQEIIYTGIEKETNAEGKPTGRFIMSGYVVSYNSIEPVSFIVVDSGFAKTIRTKLKPYNSIQCHGKIEVVHVITEVKTTSENEWGEENTMDNNRADGSSYREMICLGANGSTITTDDFSEESVAEGIKKLKAKEKVEENYGEKKDSSKEDKDDSPWGEEDTTSNDSDDDLDW